MMTCRTRTHTCTSWKVESLNIFYKIDSLCIRDVTQLMKSDISPFLSASQTDMFISGVSDIFPNNIQSQITKMICIRTEELGNLDMFERYLFQYVVPSSHTDPYSWKIQSRIESLIVTHSWQSPEIFLILFGSRERELDKMLWSHPQILQTAKFDDVNLRIMRIFTKRNVFLQWSMICLRITSINMNSYRQSFTADGFEFSLTQKCTSWFSNIKKSRDEDRFLEISIDDDDSNPVFIIDILFRNVQSLSKQIFEILTSSSHKLRVSSLTCLSVMRICPMSIDTFTYRSD